MKLRLLYHGHCFDGVASAAVFTRFYLARVRPAAEVSYAGLLHRPGALSRAQVLRAIVESDEMSAVRVPVAAGLDATEREQAFVAAQYYGYLRRTPDDGGFQAWLRVLQGGNIRAMVNGFLNSQEYQLRFGRVEH